MFPPEAVSLDIDLRPGRPFSNLPGNLSSHMSFLFSYFSTRAITHQFFLPRRLRGTEGNKNVFSLSLSLCGYFFPHRSLFFTGSK